MATKKFKDCSPYDGSSDRCHDPSDYKHTKFMKSFNNEKNSNNATTVVMALFGLGRAGSIHIANILANPRCILKYIVEQDRSRWEQARTRWNLINTEFIHPDEAGKVYNDNEVTGCLVATPTFTHEEIIINSLGAGKTVFSEKPVAETEAGTRRCYEKSREVGKPLFCAFNRRFDPTFSEIQRKVRSGNVGHVQLVKTTSRDSPLPSLAYLKISGGIFHDCAVHDIDMVSWVLGEYPTEVYSVANSHIPEIAGIDDFDNVIISLKFPSGTLGQIDLCRFACYGYDQRLEVFGPKGMLVSDNQGPNSAVHSTVTGSQHVPMYYSFPSRHADGYALELDHFLDIVGGAEPSVTGRMTLAISKIASSCEESARSGQPVKLTWEEHELPHGYQGK